MKKLYYSISEVCENLNEEKHILRYWEKEFEIIKPRKNRGGNRIYSPEDLEILKIIQTLIRKNKVPLRQAQSILAEYKSKSALIFEKDKILSVTYTKTKPSKELATKEHTTQQIVPLNDDAKKKINELFKEIFEILDDEFVEN